MGNHLSSKNDKHLQSFKSDDLLVLYQFEFTVWTVSQPKQQIID